MNVTGLSVGPHLVGVRYKDNNNTWGEVLYQTIHVYDANPDINAGGSGGSGGSGGFTVIAGAEYFIGNDPGEGNATALQPKDGAFDSEVESTLTASLSLNGYALGTYLVGVRYKDNNGTWGDVLYKTIEVDVDTDGDGLADKAEIYYETNSTVQDTDGDGYLDGEEVAFGSDPTNANSLGNRAPTDLNATSALSILENLPSGNSWLISTPPIPKPTPPSPIRLRMGTDRAEILLFHRCERYPAYRDCARSRVQSLAFDPGTGERRAQLFKRRNLHRSGQDMDEGTAPTLGNGSQQTPTRSTPSPTSMVVLHRIRSGKQHLFRPVTSSARKQNWANGYRVLAHCRKDSKSISPALTTGSFSKFMELS